MRRRYLVPFLTVALLLGTGGTATAATRPTAPAGLPLVRVPDTLVLPGFTTDSRQAVAAAKASPVMQALHRRQHPLTIVPLLWDAPPKHWAIEFLHAGKLVAEVDVTPTGQVGAVWTGLLASALYARGHYGATFDSLWVIVPFSLMFLLPFLDPRRLRRILHLDALALLSFLGSYWLFDHGHLEAAVWLVYPPLLYLVVRMVALGREPLGSGRLAPMLSTRVLIIGLLLLVGARVGLGLASTRVVDVGFSSLWGANRILLGLTPYTLLANHADTYGPITYLAYVPFQLIFGWNGSSTDLGAARAAAIAFDLITILALVGLGRRLRPAGEGRRLGLALAWAWAACPFTLLNLMMHSNDGLIAMLSVLSLLVFASGPARGAILGLAAAAKFSPAALLPLYAGRGTGRRRNRVLCLAAFVLVVALSVVLSSPPGGISEFYRETIGFQLTRTDLFSPWGLHPTLAPIKVALEVGAVALAVLLAVFPRSPRRRTVAQLAALAGAVTIAVQLPAVHWFYFYIVWFVPFVLVALLGTVPGGSPPERVRVDHEDSPSAVDEAAPEPVLVGA